MIEKINGRIKITTKTPGKNQFPWMNRKQRRDMVFSRPVMRLIEKSKDLRQELIWSGIFYLPPIPKFNNAKAWSGYHGKLCEIAKQFS